MDLEEGVKGEMLYAGKTYRMLYNYSMKIIHITSTSLFACKGIDYYMNLNMYLFTFTVTYI